MEKPEKSQRYEKRRKEIVAAGDIMEFNVFKFANRNGSLVSYQFAFREYKDIKVMRAFLANRQDYVNKVAAVVIPKTQKVVR
jgi:hypothetical protein